MSNCRGYPSPFEDPKTCNYAQSLSQIILLTECQVSIVMRPGTMRISIRLDNELRRMGIFMDNASRKEDELYSANVRMITNMRVF
jgi:hypothetical protein